MLLQKTTGGMHDLPPKGEDIMKKKIVIALAAAMTVMSLTGCQGGAGASSTTAAAVNVTRASGKEGGKT